MFLQLSRRIFEKKVLKTFDLVVWREIPRARYKQIPFLKIRYAVVHSFRLSSRVSLKNKTCPWFLRRLFLQLSRPIFDSVPQFAQNLRNSRLRWKGETLWFRWFTLCWGDLPWFDTEIDDFWIGDVSECVGKSYVTEIHACYKQYCPTPTFCKNHLNSVTTRFSLGLFYFRSTDRLNAKLEILASNELESCFLELFHWLRSLNGVGAQ